MERGCRQAPGGVIAHGYVVGRHSRAGRQDDLAGCGPARGLDGLRIGFVTDLHFSESVPADDIERALALTAAEKPDLLVFGGDYVSYRDMR